MAEVNTPRVMAAAKEFNIGTGTLVDFLESKGFERDELKPGSKISEDMYRVLQVEFQPDKVAKQKAEQIDLPKNAVTDFKKRRDEQDLSFSKKEAVKVKEEVPAPLPPVEEAITQETIPQPAAQEEQPEIPAVAAATIQEPEIESQPELTKIDAPEVEGLKVIDKIDLSTIDSSTRPKKETGKKVSLSKAKGVKSKSEEKEIIEEIQAEVATPQVPVEEEPVIITNIKAIKLEGPKIMGKIDLPSNNNTRPKPIDERRRRKRIPVEKKPSGNNNAPGIFQRPQTARPQQAGRFNRNAPQINRREEKEIDQKEIQDKIKETQAKLAGSGGRGKSLKAKYRRAKREEAAENVGEEVTDNKLQVTEFISVSEFANLMDVSFAEVISKCMSLGIMVSINQRLEADVIELVAGEFNFEVEFIGIDDQGDFEEEEEDDNEEDLVTRPPIVTIMGHVDHGKTSLLDYIRQANVIAGEAGGITQHIGAYEVTLKGGRAITFLDTPGHEAFTAMRARGAKVTDIAVIVIAADDAVMPQTKEAISHAQAANVPMIFALNKIDKDGANPEKIKEQLSAMNILVEDWGGKYQSQEISARQGLHVDELLDKILLESDLLDLKANPEKGASGTVIEASLDKGRGYVATILVQNGTLNQGDLLVSGQNYGRVKAMFNERNQRVDKAPP
ncbi:MAG: translation initiation factor IF-2, partial [Ginsengibacter sp.]